MRIWSVIGAVAVCAVAVFGSPASAAVHKTQRAAQPKIDPIKALVSMQVVNRFDEAADLGAACRQSNFKGLAYALNLNAAWLKSEKSEFETSDAFAARSGEVAKAMGVNPIIVCQPLRDNEDAPFEYKADSEQFEGSVSTRQNVWRDVKQLGKFRAKTRMGIPFTVAASSELSFDAEFEIKAHRKGCLLADRYDLNRTYMVSVPRVDAPMVKATGYLVYIARLSAPYVTTESSHDTASLDDPYERVLNGITVHAKLERLVVVDGHGKKWWECDPAKGPGASPPRPKDDPAQWVVPSDYPSYSWRPAARGDVGIELKVDKAGFVSDCAVISSSGNAEVDKATCTWASIRAKLEPAEDDLGEKTDGSYKMTVHWGG